MDRRPTAMLTLAVATILMQLPVEATEIAMRLPLLKMDRDEHVLNSNEIAESPCTNLARRVAGQLPGVVMDSEKVSVSPEFGHIYRYDMMSPVEYKGATDQVHTILVVWSEDCETCKLVTYPTYELPASSSRPR